MFCSSIHSLCQGTRGALKAVCYPKTLQEAQAKVDEVKCAQTEIGIKNENKKVKLGSKNR